MRGLLLIVCALAALFIVDAVSVDRVLSGQLLSESADASLQEVQDIDASEAFVQNSNMEEDLAEQARAENAQETLLEDKQGFVEGKDEEVFIQSRGERDEEFVEGNDQQMFFEDNEEGDDEEEAAFLEDDEEEGAFLEDDEEEGAFLEDDEEEGAFLEDDEEEAAFLEDDEEEGAFLEDDEEEAAFLEDDEEGASDDDDNEMFVENDKQALLQDSDDYDEAFLESEEFSNTEHLKNLDNNNFFVPESTANHLEEQAFFQIPERDDSLFLEKSDGRAYLGATNMDSFEKEGNLRGSAFASLSDAETDVE